MSGRPGSVRPLPFLVLTSGATLACLAATAAILLGWVGVSLAAARPIELVATSGTADSLTLSTSTDRRVTGIDLGPERAAALVRLRGGQLADLCLVPRLRLPLLGGLASVRLRSLAPVDVPDVTLAAGDGRAGRLELPATRVSSGGGPRAGGLLLQARGGPGEVTLSGLHMQAFGLVLEGGISLESLRIRPRLGDQGC